LETSVLYDNFPNVIAQLSFAPHRKKIAIGKPALEA
jgi:hypothetical protein